MLDPGLGPNLGNNPVLPLPSSIVVPNHLSSLTFPAPSPSSFGGIEQRHRHFVSASHPRFSMLLSYSRVYEWPPQPYSVTSCDIHVLHVPKVRALNRVRHAVGLRGDLKCNLDEYMWVS
ncbi:hypothetical protein L873DRAFT_1829073 [Choiromyces venosus 120613-1]|uniref:Uncharacterized protein n=1 Tax=Choiromyces venosus 120613-1 TaxID=1336337 RepID=A0A3N4JGK2_9PEZI|nr:hypothetical protein L873DRAFT_1829073 [Choiromyces venosus 120613-1]